MDANLQLSQEEMRLVTDPAWILTKNSVMRKAVALMGVLCEDYRAICEERKLTMCERVAGAFGAGPKISRGEQYRGLPWVMLDYPRLFGREDVLAIRTLFWWGHTFSVTLHLKGCWQELLLPVIAARRQALAAAGFYVGVGADEWQHELVPENYLPLPEAGELAGRHGFFKLSAAIGVHRWEDAPAVLAGMYRALVDVVVVGRAEVGRAPKSEGRD